MISTEDITSTWLSKELAIAESALAKNEQALAGLKKDGGKLEATPLESLKALQANVDCLELAKDVSTFLESFPDTDTLMNDANRCEQLAILLCRHKAMPNTPYGNLLQTLHTQEYIPLHKYCRGNIKRLLRRFLLNLGYPSALACAQVTKESTTFHADQESVSSCCYWLSRLQRCNRQVSTHMEGSKVPEESTLDVVVELCRPIVEKVRFHFLEPSEDRISSTRTDRLPEWIFNYLRENAIEGGPWEMIEEGLGPIVVDADLLVTQYLDQLARLGHFVFEQRQFFRNDAIIANPTLVSGAIEKIFIFDSYLRCILPCRPFGLAQSLIAEDQDVWLWWLDREREYYLSLLFDSPVSSSTEGLSPRAELFCAIVHSLQAKAALFTIASPYISHVGVPICQQFLDAIHETATDLKSLLKQRKLVTTEDLEKNLLGWVELINGTKFAATKLVYGTTTQGFGHADVDHDLARVGRSLERLVDVLVDECANSLVEIVLMERAKLASYLMRLSHVLMTADTYETHSISPDLQDTANIYSRITEVCSRPLCGEDCSIEDLLFAPASIQANVTNRLVDKFLEVALDAHGMTPEIVLEGAMVFARDMEGLFGSTNLQPFTMRLMDVVQFMTMDIKRMGALKIALLGLSHSFGESNILHFSVFSQDGTLMDEGTYMLRAKGFAFLDLGDAVSILNRRAR